MSVVLIDGGLGTELNLMGYDVNVIINLDRLK